MSHGKIKMANKIPFYTIVQKIQSGRITAQELRQYFLVERNPRRPFDFLVGINGSPT
jgi:hypothetical protein